MSLDTFPLKISDFVTLQTIDGVCRVFDIISYGDGLYSVRVETPCGAIQRLFCDRHLVCTDNLISDKITVYSISLL